MSFWDGYRWVDETRARQTAPGSRMQDWFVTLVMLAAFAIATVPLLAVGAASATMSVNPSQAAPGQSVALTGTGFSPPWLCGPASLRVCSFVVSGRPGTRDGSARR